MQSWIHHVAERIAQCHSCCNELVRTTLATDRPLRNHLILETNVLVRHARAKLTYDEDSLNDIQDQEVKMCPQAFVIDAASEYFGALQMCHTGAKRFKDQLPSC